MSHCSAVVDRQLEGLSHRRSQICSRNSARDCRGLDEAAIQGVETTVTIGNERERQETSVATSPASADTRSTIRTSRSDIPSMDSPDQAIVYTVDRGPRGQVVVVGDGSALARAAASDLHGQSRRRSQPAGRHSRPSLEEARRSRWGRS